MHQQCHFSQQKVTIRPVISAVRVPPLPPPPPVGLGLAWGSASPLRNLLRGMPASIKIKRRRNRAGSATGKRLDLAPEENDEFGSYHSHHHFIDENLDTSITLRQLNQPGTKTLPRDVGTSERATLFVPKAVVFSSKGAFDLQSQNSASETLQIQSYAAHSQSKAQNEQPKTGAKKKSLCLSKLTQTSSSISEKMVACRSIAVGVPSDIDHFQGRSCGKDQSRPASRNTWGNASLGSRRTQPPGSCMTISSGRYSRTESSIMAALEAPPASHRHARCMAEHSSFSSKPTKSLPAAPKRNKATASSAAKETGKRKQGNRVSYS